MSYVKTYDVFCDGKDCIAWTGSGSSRSEADRSAKREGWKKLRGGRHLCPRCAESADREGEDDRR